MFETKVSKESLMSEDKDMKTAFLLFTDSTRVCTVRAKMFRAQISIYTNLFRLEPTEPDTGYSYTSDCN